MKVAFFQSASRFALAFAILAMVGCTTIHVEGDGNTVSADLKADTQLELGVEKGAKRPKKDYGGAVNSHR